jgi:SHS2 domain-containing protein
MPYEYLDDVAIADIAFVATGRDLPETFIAAAEATLNVMIENPGDVEPRERRDLSCENEALDLLLFDFLNELIYYKDAERLMLRVRDVSISGRDGAYRLEALAEGEVLDPARHEQRADVKAVTLHKFTLEQVPEGWRAAVILDI